MIVPTSSQHPPKNRNDHPNDHRKADLRREITAFGLLDWAYRKECVKAAGEQEWTDILGYAPSSIAKMATGDIGVGHGTINGRLDVHVDALAVDAFVRKTAGDHYEMLTLYCEKGKAVPHPDFLPIRKLVPAKRLTLDGIEKVKMIRDPVSHRMQPLLVWDDGYDDLAIAKWCLVYKAYIDVLVGLLGLKLELWKVLLK